MNKCRRLEEYSVFIVTVRKYVEKHKDLNMAINLAVDECIEKEILKDLLLKCRAEVIDMVLTSFSMEEYEQTIRDESYHEGIEAGEKIGIRKGIEAGEKIGIRKGIVLAKRGNCLKKQGYSEEYIAADLQISVEEVRELLEE